MSTGVATVANVIIEELRAAGVRALFGVPGGASNLDLVEAAGRAGLPFVLTATETAAAIAAVAQAEVTGQLGACLTTLGPGAASAVNGIACAFLDRAPLVVFTDGHSRGTFEHQRLDHAALFAPITKASFRLTPGGARADMAAACRLATSPRPGPVHVECPGEVGAAVVPGNEKDVGCLFTEDVKRHPTSFSVPHGRKPLLLVGLGARRPEDATAIRALCDRRHLPAMVTYKAKGVVPDGHPWFAGVFTNGAIEQPLIDQSDLLIGIGLDPVELIPRDWKHRQPIVYAGPWPVEAGHVPFSEQHIATVPECVAKLEGTLALSNWDATRVRAAVNAQRRAINAPADGLTAQRVVEIAAARLASTSRATVDAGAHMFPATTLWPIGEPNQMLISNGLSTMGFALPAAIGAALADRSRPVVAGRQGPTVVLTGDAGLLMSLGELLTMVREQLRIIVIVFSDASLSLIEIKQQARRLQPSGVAIGPIDWPALARSVGATAFVADTEHSLDRAIDAARRCAGPALIEAKIDRSNYGATLRAIRG